MDIETHQKTAGNFLQDAGRWDKVLDNDAMTLLENFVSLGRTIENMKKAGAYSNLDTDKRRYLKGYVGERSYDLGGTPSDVIHGILGIAGEASELVEVLIESLQEGWNEERKAKVVDEQGDSLWYHIPLTHGTEVPIGEVLQQNYDKLAERYKKK